MPDPLVVQVMREFKRLLAAREHDQMVSMAARWLDVERALDADIAALAQDFADRRAEGRAISEAALFRMDRYQSLMRQLARQTERYEEYAVRTVSNGQRVWARLGIEHAAQTIGIQRPDAVGAWFDRLPVEAVENMVGLAGDGAPLGNLLRAGWGDAASGLTRELVTSTALGRNPRETARLMKRGMSQGLNRALTIARTEQARVYRQSSQEQYAASGVVYGHRRLAAHDDRTCPACLAADGELLDVNEPLYDHPNGRCTSIPLVDGLPAVQFETGQDWLRKQDADTQRRILGRGRYEMYRDGTGIDEMFQRVEDDTWGASLQVMPQSLNQTISGGFDPDRAYRTPEDLRNRRSLMFAKRNTPQAMWDEQVSNEVTEFMYGFFELDPNTAEPGFNPELIQESQAELMIEVYRLGRGDVPTATLQDIRRRASGIVAANDWVGGVFDRGATRLLENLASEDDDAVLTAIDRIRDRRQRGELAWREAQSGRRSYKTSWERKFQTAAQADASEFMREWNAAR